MGLENQTEKSEPAIEFRTKDFRIEVAAAFQGLRDGNDVPVEQFQFIMILKDSNLQKDFPHDLLFPDDIQILPLRKRGDPVGNFLLLQFL